MNDREGAELRLFASDHLWVQEHQTVLLEKYSDQWVAVRNGRVIGSSPDFNGLFSRLEDPAHTCIEYITRDSVEMIL